jgi:CHAT domain-containing protein
LRFLPSELLLLADQPPQPSLRFVGIGDPVYNFADSRLAAGRFPADAKTTSGVALARLVGSEREVRSAAQLSGLHDQEILLGPRANSAELQKSLANDPEVIHFAVHVVSPPERPEEAALALSLKNGMPELLTPEAIAALRVPGSLVVLSGCSSGQGKALPSAGLQGLSRAWLLAGAAAVIVSSWPTPDDSGRFFSAFYGHLQVAKAGPLAQRAARALQQTQLDMQQSKGKSGAPSFWAAYSLISKE